jgi:hypothetical protein
MTNKFSISVLRETQNKEVYSLQSRDDTAASRSGARSRSWSGGGHPVAVGGISSNLLTVHALTLFHRGRRGKVPGGTREDSTRVGERRGGGERSRLLGSVRVGCESFNLLIHGGGRWYSPTRSS